MSNPSSNYRYRFISPHYTRHWGATNEVNDIADEIIAKPEQYLLSADGLNDAEGGHLGQVL